MDGAWIGSIDISQKKAYTSRAFDIATKDLAQHSQSGGQFFGIHVSNDGKIMIFAGGIPLKRDGKVVGAIGVSGGSGDQDHAVAEAGWIAFVTSQTGRSEVYVSNFPKPTGKWQISSTGGPDAPLAPRWQGALLCHSGWHSDGCRSDTRQERLHGRSFQAHIAETCEGFCIRGHL